MASESPPDEVASAAEAAEEAEITDALDLLFAGRVEELVPPEEMGEFHDFIREEAILRRRFAVSFRLDCGCLAWIGYALANVVTHEDGLEFTANATESFIPDHEADVEHPEGPTEDPPEAFAERPIWPFEIYQDEVDAFDGRPGLDARLGELAEELGMDEGDDLAPLREVAAQEDPEATDAPGN